MTIAIIVAVCIVLLVLAFPLPRLTGPQGPREDASVALRTPGPGRAVVL